MQTAPTIPPARAETSTLTAGREIYGLNGLRALAVLAVIPHNLDLLDHPGTLGEHALASFLDRGWIGVQLFFVLSGFLISGILMDHSRAENYYSSFFARRALRIMPLYYLTLVVVLMVFPALHWLPASVPRSPAEELCYWLFITNWYAPFHVGEGSMRHLWSLAVEEQFYLLWPLLLHGRSPQKVLRLCLGVAASSLAFRVAMLSGGLPIDEIYSFSITRMDALALGGAVAALVRMPSPFEEAVKRRTAIAAAACLLLIVGGAVTRGFTFTSLITQSVGYLVLAAAFALLILHQASGGNEDTTWWSRMLRYPPMQRIGRYSYGMYLLHVPLDFTLRGFVLSALGIGADVSVAGDVVYMLTMTVLTYGLAALSFRYFESYFLRQKVRFLPKNLGRSEPVVS